MTDGEQYSVLRMNKENGSLRVVLSTPFFCAFESMEDHKDDWVNQGYSSIVDVVYSTIFYYFDLKNN